MNKHIQDQQWYRLDPPARVGEKEFDLVLCEYEVPDAPDEYCVRGVPKGGIEEEAFILRFTQKGKVGATPARAPLHLVQ